jgi:hypothetical protein
MRRILGYVSFSLSCCAEVLPTWSMVNPDSWFFIHPTCQSLEYARMNSYACQFDRYHEADMRTGEATHWQLTSLQAFWPGLQVC